MLYVEIRATKSPHQQMTMTTFLIHVVCKKFVRNVDPGGHLTTSAVLNCNLGHMTSSAHGDLKEDKQRKLD